MKDYYEVLGIDRNASKDEIKRAYHRLAHKFHPDKKGGDEQKFKEVNEAYQVLSNEQKRKQYDQFGNVSGTGQGPGTAGWDFSGFRGFDDVEVGDIFETFFGQGGFRSGGGRRRGRDISIDIDVPFQEAVFGTERRVLIRKHAVCDECGGTGAEKGTSEISCTACHGAGTVRDTKRSFFGTFTQIVECARCHGRGKVPERKCSMCKGERVFPKSEEIHIVVPAGIENGEVVRIAEKGEAARDADPGDLYVKIRVLPHPRFRRSKNDLLMRLEIPLSEALLGGSQEVETLDGKIRVKIPQGVHDGEVLKVHAKGVPRDDGSRGDLLIEVKIKMPKKISSTLKALIEELKKEGL